MESLLRVWRRLLFLFRRNQMDQDLAEEMQFHIEMKAHEKRQTGMGEKEAQQAASREFGNTLLLKEVSREVWGFCSIDCQGENSLTTVAGSSRRHVQSVSTNEAEIQAPTCCLSQQWPSPQDTTQPDSSNVPAALGRFQSRCIRPYTSRA